MSEFGVIERLRHRAARFIPAAPATVRAPGGLLSLSFDDFPASAWLEGGPVLADHGVKATYYLCGGLCGTERLGLPQFELSHLQALAEAGHEVGCHTFGHESVLALSDVALEASCARNAVWVADRLDGYAMTSFAFPFGYWSVGAKRVIARRFLAGRGVRDGVNAGRADRAGLQAIGLESRRLPGYDLDHLCAEAAATDGWLIGYGHDVSEAPSPYGCRARDVERLILSARAAGLQILPVGEAAERALGGVSVQAAA